MALLGGTSTTLDLGEVVDHLPDPHVVTDHDLVVVAANRAYLELCGLGAADVLGRAVVATLPPQDPVVLLGRGPATGVPQPDPVADALGRALATGTVQAPPLRRCRGSHRGAAGPRWWSVTCAPVPGADGHHRHVVSQWHEVTDEETEAAARVSTHRMARLVDVALHLTAAETVADVERIVMADGLRLLGADGGGVVTPAEDGGWRLTSSSAAGSTAEATYAWAPHDSPLPACHCARTGERLLLPTRAAAVAFHPEMAAVNELTGRAAWAVLPLVVGQRPMGSLLVSWSQEHPFPVEEVDLLDALAVQCGLALDRITTARLRAEASASVHRMAETLQRSLLSGPVVGDDLAVAVRYQAAAAGAEVGGDFHDAFETRSGGTVLVVGDVTGHDQAAAASMSQIRNMLRGIAFDGDDRPAPLMSQLDRAMAGLQLETLATAVLVVVAPAGAGSGPRRASFVNAGHLPPLLRRATGDVERLEPPHELLLGLDPTASRREHDVELHPGDTLVLYTDGLVERRGDHLDEGVERLRAALRTASHDPGTCCDELLAVRHDRADDAALLVVTVTADPDPAGDDGPAEVVLPADLRAVRDARHLTADRCRHAGLDEDLTDTAVLLTSELTTNAIIHGRSEARLRVHATPAGVRVEVGDDDDRAPVLQARDDDALTGRGISLLERAATTWGVREAVIGKVVWFELRAR